MFTLVLILPLISFLFILIFGRYFGTVGSIFFSCLNVIISFIISIILFLKESYIINSFAHLWLWVNLNNFPVYFTLQYDSLTAIIFLVVTLVSSVVHMYSCVYIYTDPFLTRFISYLSLFTFFILLLVSSGNLLVLFIGWEGVGLCSYLLIGFWHTRLQASKSATKAFVINKIGDLFLLTGLGMLYIVFHTLDFNIIASLLPFCPENIVELISIFLFMGAVGKSAQIGLHSWLPDAMEGPTPVSALIHAATIVTAGVFLIIRCSFIFEYAPRILYIIAIWGGITAFISGMIGSVQNDIKKIIAYSTCSQLGYIVLSCGLSLYNVSLFHLFNHAFFKALLFLSAGSIIHILNNEQDIRKIGGMGAVSPFIYMNILIGSLALIGVPFLAGFYSKDIIIETAVTKYWVTGQFFYWLASISAIFTVYYSIRLIIISFVNNFNGFKVVIKNFNKPTIIEFVLLGCLSFCSILTGFYFKDLFIGLGSNYFNNAIYNLPNTWTSIDLEFIPIYIKLMPVFMSILSIFIILKLNSQLHMYHIKSVKTFFELGKLFYNELINTYIALLIINTGRHVFEQYEKRGLEINGPVFFVGSINKILKILFFK